MSEAAMRLPPLLVYPERAAERETWALRLARGLEARLNARFTTARGRRLARVATLAAAHASALAEGDEAELKRRIRDAAARLRGRSPWSDETLALGFAVVREAAARRLGQRPYDVQLIGACAILRGMIAQMATGEGKTLTAALAASVAALAGEPVHVVTVNEYLAARDEEALRPLYASLGLTTGLIRQEADAAERAAAYACDIVYGANKDLAFDYMRDRLAAGGRIGNLRRKAAGIAGRPAPARSLLRGLHFAIVDEADSVLIDEARTPLILSGDSDATRDEAMFDRALALARSLRPALDFELVANERRVALTASGRRALAATPPFDPPWNIPAERERLIVMALTAIHMLHADEHYLVREGRIEIIDEYTGRTMPDRTWSDGLHELVERKERLELSPRRGVRARMTYQRFFRRYRRLGGMTGTAAEVAAEMHAVYRLPVAAVPPNRPDAKIFDPPRAFVDAEGKWRAVVAAVAALHAKGAPALIGVRTVDAAARAAAALTQAGLPHVVLSAAEGAYEAEIIGQAGRHGAITVATNMAGRGADIRLDRQARQAGGLHVIVSEPHEAGRIDRQLAGRCGRQGEPGRVLAFAALDDALVQRHAPLPMIALARLAARLGAKAPIAWTARHAQRRAEALHARMRRDLLRSDEWLGDAIAFVGEPE